MITDAFFRAFCASSYNTSEGRIPRNRHRNAIRGSIIGMSALFAHPQQTTIAFLINRHCKASLSKAHGALTQMLAASNCDNSPDLRNHPQTNKIPRGRFGRFFADRHTILLNDLLRE